MSRLADLELKIEAMNPEYGSQIVIGAHLAGLRAKEEEKKAKEEAQRKKILLELVPGEGFIKKEVKSFSDSLEGEFDIVEHIIHHCQERVLTTIICTWLLGMGASTWLSVWSISIPVFISIFVACWRHRKKKAFEPKPIAIPF